jgi:hypothetical protein
MLVVKVVYFMQDEQTDHLDGRKERTKTVNLGLA